MSAETPITLGPILATTRAEYAARTTHHNPPPPGRGTAEHGEPGEDERDWRDDAACRTIPDDFEPHLIEDRRRQAWVAVFYPNARLHNGEEDPQPREAAPARAICAGCPVRAECRTFAVENREPSGIWGGQTISARKREHKRRLRGVA